MSTGMQNEHGNMWERVRHCIEHEDNVTNHRITWLLTMEGFVLAAFFLAQNAVFSGELSWGARLGAEGVMILVLGAAAWISQIALTAVVAAQDHLHNLRDWWWDGCSEEELPERYHTSNRFAAGNGWWNLKRFLPIPWWVPKPLSELYSRDGQLLYPNRLRNCVKKFPPILGHYRVKGRLPRKCTIGNLPWVVYCLNCWLVLLCVVIACCFCPKASSLDERTKTEYRYEHTEGEVQLKMSFDPRVPDEARKSLLDAVGESIDP